ncbi:MAG TPA: hypothetical protein PKY88_09465 [Anaerohalosphaeraceae bacterium]|nr:hypothetical protein [Anaerohalosphaeraceae bacterium]
MPYTPYHFGLHGFVGLLFRRRMDVPMILLANVLLDIEVLAAGWFAYEGHVHQFLRLHTLLVGGAAGAAMGAAAYYLKPLRKVCELAMALAGLPSRATLLSMTAGGLLGAWLHVLIDALYHLDIQPLWPYSRNPFIRNFIGPFGLYYPTIQRYVRTLCIAFWALFLALYLWLILKKIYKAWRSPA